MYSATVQDKKEKSEMKETVIAAISMVMMSLLFAGCQTMTGKSAGEIVDDSIIVSRINAKIVADADLQFLKIDVDSDEGNVTLSGFVPSSEAEERLVRIAEETKGVTSVKNNLQIKKD